MTVNVPALLLLATLGQPAVEQPVAPPPTQQHGTGLWIGGIAFAPDDIASATQQFDRFVATPNVVITLTETGRAKFQQAQQGRLNQELEISVDGEVVSSPYLREMIAGNEIAISGTFSVEEAATLARRIAPPRGR